MPKGKVKKHTAAELKKKEDAHKNKGGGAAGHESRKPKTTLTCKICKASAPSLTTMKDHYQSKHPKETIKESDYEAKSDASS